MGSAWGMEDLPALEYFSAKDHASATRKARRRFSSISEVKAVPDTEGRGFVWTLLRRFRIV